MAKRSNFTRRKHDQYFTPLKQAQALFPHLEAGTNFAEPCCGNGRLIRHLEGAGHLCSWNADISPQMYAPKLDATKVTDFADYADMIITNPPWTWRILEPMLMNFYCQLPAWILHSADLGHTKQFAKFMPYCAKIVAAGRAKWIEDSKHSGKDNTAWYLIDKDHTGPTEFIGWQETGQRAVPT